MGKSFRPRFHLRGIACCMGLVAVMFAFGLVMVMVQGQPSIHELFQAIWVSVICWIAVLIHLLATVAVAQYSAWKRARDRRTS